MSGLMVGSGPGFNGIQKTAYMDAGASMLHQVGTYRSGLALGI